MVKYGGACQLVKKLCGLSGNLGRTSRVFCLEAECPTPFHTEVVMRYRHLIALAGGGLVMLVLAVLLFTGRLPYFTAEVPEEDPAPPTNVLTSRSGSNELAAGGLFVFRPGAHTPSNWAETLKSRGVTIGSPTGDGAYLIRVPEGTALIADKLPGAYLRAYTVEERLSGELRAAVSTIKSEAKVGARTGKEDSAGTPSDAAERPPETPSAIGEITVTVSLFDPADKHRVAGLIRELGGSVLRGLDEDDAAALRVTLPAQSLAELAAAPETVYIESYTSPDMLNDRARDVIAAAPVSVPDFITRTGLRGAGQIVALADSGIDHGSLSDIHPDLASTPGRMPKVLFINPFSGDDPSDPIGHGTHMAATIAGTGAASGGKYRGVAPEAALFVQSILNNQGRIDPPADLVSLFRPAYAAGARIHVNGWGGKTNAYLSASAQVDRFVRYYPDFLVIFGAGNDGPFTGTLTPEANSKNALVVGASQSPRPNFGAESQDAGSLALFSSRGPAADNRIKPDLVVPGSAIISAKSGLIEGNFDANPAYTRLQGTSMSAAVAGGASALLREYLQKEHKLTNPTAALLKALLINGARPLKGTPPGSGFGLLDLTGTLLALEEGTFQYSQAHTVGTGDARTYTFEVEHGDAPFKATLAWTDPTASPGAARALVNDLDLTVIGPDGEEYLGNDFEYQGKKDTTNNVEQVTIYDPAPGTYKIIVRGAEVSENVKPGSSRPVQDFALVYGQPLLRETVADGDARSLTLAKGGKVNLSAARVSGVTNEEPGPPQNAAGADAYLLGPRTKPEAAFLVGREWRAGAVKGVPLGEDRFILVPVDPQSRDGGYGFVPGRPVFLNGNPIETPAGIPVGAYVTALVNPSTQQVWRIDAGYQEQRGVLASIDYPAQRIRLLGDSREYVLSNQAAIAHTQNLIGGDRKDLPFGAAASSEVPSLFPGVSVRIVLTPGSNVVNYLVSSRHAVVGTLQSVSAAEDGGTIWLAGRQYAVLPDIAVERDGLPAALHELAPGDLVFATVIPGENQVIQIAAHSSVMYGQVIYAGSENIYLSDYRGDLHTLHLSGDTRVFRWGISGDASLLSPGLMVRVTLAPGTREIGRIDIAEEHTWHDAIVASYDRERAELHTGDGESYPVAANTAFTKNGLPVRPTDLRPGESISLTVLSDPEGRMVVARGSASTRPGTVQPDLKVDSVIPLSDRYIVTGTTSADRLYAWIGAPAFDQLQLTGDGAFYWSVPYGPDTGRTQLVAVDSRTGGVAGQTVDLPVRSYQNLGDIQDSWAREDIERLTSRGLVSGYPDGSFRPNNPVTRAEFAVLLGRLLGPPTDDERSLPFKDAASIPDWARDTIAVAHCRGIASGYEDGTFRPHERISRAEAAAILARGCTVLGIPVPDEPVLPAYTDWETVPEWARLSVAEVYAAGIMRGRDDRFVPYADLSRAEATAILGRLLQKLEE